MDEVLIPVILIGVAEWLLKQDTVPNERKNEIITVAFFKLIYLIK